jgi:spoIIIJ-associated protein
VGGKRNHLVVSYGEVIEALPELTRLSVQTESGDRSSLMLDIEIFRANRRKELSALAKKLGEEAKS